MAHEIGKRLIQEFPQFDGFEIVLATHKDKHHLHNHFALNSVNAKTGCKWQHNRKYITFTTPDGKKCRNSKLSNPEYFSKENM